MSKHNPILCQTCDDMTQALQAAATSHKDDRILQSARHLVPTLGVPVIWAMWQQAKATVPDAAHIFILDCGDDAAAVMNGVRTGFTHFRYTGAAETAEKLRSMAEQVSGALLTHT